MFVRTAIPHLGCTCCRCPECSHGDLDLNHRGDGRWKIEWYAVPCPVGDTNIRYDIVVSSQYWFSLVISNTRSVCWLSSFSAVLLTVHVCLTCDQASPFIVGSADPAHMVEVAATGILLLCLYTSCAMRGPSSAAKGLNIPSSLKLSWQR